MSSTIDRLAARRVAWVGAVLAALGALLSGPVGFAIVAGTHPQPAWRDARLFVEHYHPVQTVPFVFGFLLVGGFVVMSVGLHELAMPAHRPTTGVAMLFTTVFAALVFLNYFAQTMLVPGLLADPSRDAATAVSIFSMSNPRSLAWTVEMGAYGLLGIATWLQAPAFSGSRAGSWASGLFVANGVMSVIGTLWTVMDPGWVLTAAGLVAFGSWNVLIVAATVCSAIALRRCPG